MVLPGSDNSLFFEKSIATEARDSFRKDALASLIGGLYTGATAPFILYIARDRLHSSVALIGLINASFYIGSMFGMLWANAVGGKRIVRFTTWVWVLGRSLNLLILLAYTPLVFALTITAIQFIATICTPAYAAIMKAIYPDDQRGKIMGYCRVCLALATIAGTFAAGSILHRWADSYRMVFAGAGLVGIGAALIFGRIKMPIREESDPSPPLHMFIGDSLDILRRNKRYRWFAISVFTYGVGFLLLSPIYPIYQVDVLHIKATQLAMLSNISQIAYMISFLYWGSYVDRNSPIRAAFLSILVSLLIPLNYMFSHSVWALWPAFVVQGFFSAGIELSYFNCTLYLAESDKIAQYQGLHTFLLGIRGIIAPFAGVAIMESGIDIKVIFFIGLVIMLIGGVVQAVALKKDHIAASNGGAE